MQSFARWPGFARTKTDIFQSGHEIRQRNARLHSGQRRSQTEMESMTKGQVRIGIARDIEPVGIMKLRAIAISRSDNRKQ